ncbi:KpsF/GutQ family sugar-phosphate isomerase [Hydrotalea sandarakina]|jgi:arabinose-5-phosphate isomerase|uniref:Arabinose-5-phosphate isomerase n=1 Tax=Hydrotalea sandarakina TaxID=1004304 RepID=A0A2W7RVL4_9BACT|nr:KpsF/GutQ family sugar-phosphate isomerase [Hydrotalea sandarakina]PZX62886.1 arabinose-5-phosphate isomerase [Hydrotalea sandarakina]
MNHQITEKAKETIAIEAAAIQQLTGFVNEQFAAAVQAIYNAKGRLVVTGIGKSAIVGQKIVATLNSTGTPALFMHAADAIHGDLGMVQQDDLVMVISKSGESPEIKVLVPFIQQLGNPIIALVGNTQSFLAQTAQYVIACTVEKEACPNNLAPTTSTTAQMVMGDALAIALMTLNGFDGKDFAKYHPGGNLGKRLYLKVADLYVHNAMPKVMPNASLKEVIVEITQNRLGVTAVVEKNNDLCGIITDGDLRRMLNKTDVLTNITAADIFTPNPKTITPQALAVEALEVLKKYDISQLVVAENNQYLGIIHLHDLIREGII